MLATTTTLGCGMSICVALWTAEIEAAKPKIYRFPGGTIVVQPGPTAAAVKVPATETASTDDRSPSPAIRLTSLSTQLEPPPLPVDEQPLAARAPATLVVSDPACSPLERLRQYEAVYNSIPFSRAEYDANPSYRHDTTVEVLFGQMRPTVIHRGHTTVTVQQPESQGVEWSPYVYYGRSGWYAPYPAPGYRVFRGW